MSQQKTWPASHSAAVNLTKLTGCGGSTRLYAGNAGSSEMRSFLTFTTDWTGVGKIVSAVMQVYDDDQNGLIPPPGTNTPQTVVRLLSGSWSQGNNADGVFDASDYTAPASIKSPQVITNMAKAVNGLTNIDVTALVESIAPSNVQKRDGTPGGQVVAHGWVIQRDGSSTTNGWSGWSHMYTIDTSKQPVIVLTYELAATAPNAPTSLTPTGSTTQGTFEGDFTSTDSSDTLSASEVEVYPDSATNSGQTVTGTVIWSQKSAASAAQTLAAHFILTPANLPTVTGTPYKWRARVYAAKGGVGPWTDLVEYTETNTAPDAPTLSPVDGTSVSTLNGVQFRGGTFSDPDAGDVLAAYQIEMSAYPSGDAHWTDDAFLLWETGKVLTPSGATDWQRPYGGNALTAGTYYWRARQWDNRESVSAWSYASIVLTEDFDPAPGSQDTPQINPHAPWRIVLRTLAGGGTVGGGTLTGAHSTSLLTTGSAHGLVAGNTIKFGSLSGGTGLTTTSFYYVLAAGLTTTSFKVSLTPGTTGAIATFSSDVTAGSVVQYTRGPGAIVGILENAKSVGASIVYNSPGQLHFTLDIDHQQISVCLPRLTHYALEFYGGDGWREVFAGLLTDFDATETSVIFQGVDYLGLFASNYDERYDPSNAELPVPTGSKYVNKTIGYIIKDQLATAIARSNSIVGFITVGDIAGYVSEVSPGSLSEKETVYSTFQATLPFVASLIESHKQGTGKNTQVKVVKNTDSTYSVVVVDDPGIQRDNLTLRYGELIQGYRVVPFGPSWASTQHLIGRTREGLRVFYETKSAPNIDPGVWGYWAQAQVVEDLADENDAIRRTLQQAIVAGKLGKQMGFGIRSGFLQPRDGYDVTDVLPVEIIHGAVDTTRFGDGLWVCYAIAWEAGDDGSQNVILTVLPKDDASSPDPDLIPSVVLSPQAEWQIGWAPPDPLVETAAKFLDQTTGIGYQRNDDGTYSTIDSVGGVTYPAAPDKPTVSSVTSSVAVADDGTIHATAVVTVTAPSTSALQQHVFLTPDSGTPLHAVVPLGATTVAFPVKPASSLSVTAYATDTFGNVSIAADAVLHTVTVDSTAPAVPTGLTATGAILGAYLTWTKNTEADFDHYDVALSTDGGSTYPTVYACKTVALTLVQLTAGTTYNFKVRAVDTTGNASAYSSAVTATPRTIVTADITALNITTGLLAALAVTGAKVAANAIDITKLASGLLPVQVVSSLPSLPNSAYPIGAIVFNTADSTLHKTTDGNNWVLLIGAGDIIANSITAGQIAAGTITATQIAAATILAANIAAGTITTNEIAAGTILAANIAAGTITGDKIAANTITAGLLAAKIVLASLFVAGVDGGARIEMDANGIRDYNSSGTLLVNIPTNGQPVTVNAEIIASSLNVTGNAEFQGTANQFDKSSVTALQSVVQAPTQAPLLVAGWPAASSISLSVIASGSAIGGGYYDAAGGASGSTACYVINDSGSIREIKASDLSLDRSTHLSTFSAPSGFDFISSSSGGGFTRIGTSWYGLYVLRKTIDATMHCFLAEWTRSTGAFVALYDISNNVSLTSVGTQNWLCTDGTYLYVLDYSNGAGPSIVGWTTAGVWHSSKVLTTPSGMSSAVGPISLVWGDSSHFRVEYLKTGTSIGRYYEFDPASTTATANTDFLQVSPINPNEEEHVLLWDGTNYWDLTDNGAETAWGITKYTNWDWTTASAIYWVCYAWYDQDGTTHETVVGPRASITMDRRQQLTVANATIPAHTTADDPDRVRIYMKPNATDPGAGNFKLQATDALTTRILTTYASGGAADGAGTAFPAGTPAELKSATAGWSLKGDGTMTATSPNFTTPTLTGKVTSAGLQAVGGSAFPGSPATNDSFFRTDLGQEFYYDGTRWLSTTLYEFWMAPNGVSAPMSTGISATTTAATRSRIPSPMGGSDIYIVDHLLTFDVNLGSALSGSNKWVGTFGVTDNALALTTIATITIASGASSQIRKQVDSVNALLSTSKAIASAFCMQTNWTKTGTPGSLLFDETFTYRIVAA